MSIEKDMTEEFDAMAAEIPGFIAASLVDLIDLAADRSSSNIAIVRNVVNTCARVAAV